MFGLIEVHRHIVVSPDSWQPSDGSVWKSAGRSSSHLLGSATAF